MAFEYLDEGSVVRCVASGAVSGTDALRVTTALLSQCSRVDQSLHVMVDLSAAQVNDFSGDEVRALADLNYQLTALAPQVAVAIVAPQSHVFGLARMWQVYAQRTHWKTGVFRAAADAACWLHSLPAPPLVSS